MSTKSGQRFATQYRIRVKRVGLTHKDNFRWSEPAVKRLLLLLGPEPWKAYTEKDPDAQICCDGRECGCIGATVREQAIEQRKNLPPIESVEVSRRTVEFGSWTPIQRKD